MKYTAKQKDEARASLQSWLPEGATVWITQRWKSREGLGRRVSLYFIENNELRFITTNVAYLQGYSLARGGERDELRTNEYLDEVIANLSVALHGRPGALKSRSF